MHNIKLRSHVGSDGILHLDVPVEVTDTDLEVTVTIKPITPTPAPTEEQLGWPTGFFEKTAGCLEDDPLIRYPQGELPERDGND